MYLINYPKNIDELFASQGKLVLGLLISGFILVLLKRVINRPCLNRIKAIDIFPIFALIAIPVLTLNQHGNTYLPSLIFLWMMIGIVWILYLIFTTGDLILKRFLIAFWRFSDLYWLFFYVVCFAYKLIKH